VIRRADLEREAPEKDVAMRGPIGGPRLLLRRLREVMAEPISAQDRLDKIVVFIAANMVAEVCSVYVLRADSRLELFATEGLNREAVHLTTMRKGEARGSSASSLKPPNRWRLPMRSITLPFPTGRKPAKRSIPPSLACRFCAAA
jgi:hypothetical protein